jgi:hypothetical protein
MNTLKRKNCEMTSPISNIFSPSKEARSAKRDEVKIFNDPIHESIKMESLCLKIIDTVEYQRLHHLKQLGVCDYVFRGATHTRLILKNHIVTILKMDLNS